MRWIAPTGAAIGLLVSLAAAPGAVTAPPPDGAARAKMPDEAARHTAWIEASLRRMQTVRPGMTRGELLKVFTTEGGLSTGVRRTYVYRDCPYIKVDVEFRPVGRPERDREGRITLEEDPRDVITRISQPYLQWSILD